VIAALAIAATLGPVQAVHGASAYAPCSSGGITADGHRPYTGVIASNTLPMHTLIRTRRRIFGRHFFRVRDTGSSLMSMDFWTPSCSQAIRFGRRTVRYRVVHHRRAAA
jgi:3D (Asp-Asp-Asp) domain-containing protein